MFFGKNHQNNIRQITILIALFPVFIKLGACAVPRSKGAEKSPSDDRRILNKILLKARHIAIKSTNEIDPLLAELDKVNSRLRAFAKKIKVTSAVKVTPVKVTPVKVPPVKVTPVKVPPAMNLSALPMQALLDLVKEAQTIVLEASVLMRGDSDKFLDLYRAARTWLKDSLNSYTENKTLAIPIGFGRVSVQQLNDDAPRKCTEQQIRLPSNNAKALGMLYFQTCDFGDGEY